MSEIIRTESLRTPAEVRSLYFRHALKASAAVASEAGVVSPSALHPEGSRESFLLGRFLPEPLGGDISIGHSNQIRTFETAVNTGAGYSNIWKTLENKPQELPELSVDSWPKPAMAAYVKIWEENKVVIMRAENKNPEDFSKLDPFEQARIAEAAEETIVADWVENPVSELAKMFPPETQAAIVAKLVQEDILKPVSLKSGTKLEQFRLSHKTVFEPLLMKILLNADGTHVRKLADIGGAMGLNDGFIIDSKRVGDKVGSILTMYRVDRSSGEPRYKRTRYNIDMNELDRLAAIGRPASE